MIWTLLTVVLAQDVGESDEVLPVPEGEIEEPRRGPDRENYEAIGQMQRLLELEQQGKRASDDQIRELQEQLRRAAARTPVGPDEEPVELAVPASGTPTRGGTDSDGPPSSPAPSPSTSSGRSPAALLQGLKRPKVGDRVGARGATPVPSGPQPLVFALPQASTRNVRVLPAGSYVKARILTGVEADDRTLVPMTLQADYAAVGPNGHQVDLTGCMLIAQVKGQLSTDRVVGKAVRLSCVRGNSQVVDVEIDGYLAGEDSTLGIVGKLISRQGRVLAAAAVANLAKGAGDAIAAANTTTSLVTTPIAGPTGEVAQNVTGNSTAFVAGSSVAAAAEDVADWYLRYAEKLTPAIAVGSGRDVWIVLLKATEFPGLEG